jgi:transposase-like protein
MTPRRSDLAQPWPPARPNTLARQAAAKLAPVLRIASGSADSQAWCSLGAEADAAVVITDEAHRVNTLEAFQALLSLADPRSIRRLPLPLQAEPLTALGARIARLPAQAQQPAIDAFVASAGGQPEPRPELLDALMKAAADGPLALAARERDAATGPASDAVRVGENVQVTARRHGITQPALLATLEQRATFCPGLRAINRGEVVGTVVRRLGITAEQHIAVLTHRAASRAVEDGANVRAVAERLGITDAKQIEQLQCRATTAVGIAAAERGERIPAVAKRFGITDPAQIDRLKRAATLGPGFKALQRGERVATVAQRLGISGAIHLEALERQAAFLGAITPLEREPNATAAAPMLGSAVDR